MRWLSGLVLRVATRQVAANKASADQSAARKERGRLDRVLDAEARVLADKLGGGFREFVSELVSTDALRGLELRFSSSDTALELAVAVPTSQTPPPPPPLDDAAAPLAIRIHSSVVNEKITGETLTELQPILDRFTTRMPTVGEAISDQMQDGESTTDWSDDRQWLTILWSPE